jgi:hypothetical protein
MTQQHPINPPPELVKQWREAPEFSALSPCVMVTVTTTKLQDIATQAAQWGSNQELEACCEWLKNKHWIEPEFTDELYAARRPQPPSLKEQALDELHISFDRGYLKEGAADTIRRALEQLND